MTRPDEMREMAEKIARNHVCNGNEPQTSYEIGYIRTLTILIEDAIRTAHRQGQESMRWKIAKYCYDKGSLKLSDDISELPLEPDTEGPGPICTAVECYCGNHNKD